MYLLLLIFLYNSLLIKKKTVSKINQYVYNKKKFHCSLETYFSFQLVSFFVLLYSRFAYIFVVFFLVYLFCLLIFLFMLNILFHPDTVKVKTKKYRLNKREGN